MTMMRSTTILLSIIAVLLVGGCGLVRGAKDIETDVGGAEGLNEGSGILTGKRGGIVIFQK
jgi:hypothetical protein